VCLALARLPRTITNDIHYHCIPLLTPSHPSVVCVRQPFFHSPPSVTTATT
jgi:hypothetical protein